MRRGVLHGEGSAIERGEVLEVARAVGASNLAYGASGNLSRLDAAGNGFWVTPSGVGFNDLTAAGLVWVPLEGEPEPGSWRPSSEWRLHQAIYRALPGARGVVHVHPPFATALAVARVPLPLVHYQIAEAGPLVPLAPYRTFGSAELAEVVAGTLQAAGARAALMANHGMVAAGPDLLGAFRLAQDVEWAARIYLLARAAGEPAVLSPRERRAVLEALAGYGQDPQMFREEH